MIVYHLERTFNFLLATPRTKKHYNDMKANKIKMMKERVRYINNVQDDLCQVGKSALIDWGNHVFTNWDMKALGAVAEIGNEQ